MKFKIHVENSKGDWWESYDKNVTDPQQWAENTIAAFNATLRPGEKPRTLLGVEVENASNDNLHDWVKRTDGMSVPFRRRLVDLMFCSKCGITGKRFGIGSSVKIDSKYRKKAYLQCHTAKEQRAKDDA